MKIGFFGGNVLKLTEDMGILKPTFFPSVPRLFNRIHGKIKDKFKEATGVAAPFAIQIIVQLVAVLFNARPRRHDALHPATLCGDVPLLECQAGQLQIHLWFIGVIFVQDPSSCHVGLDFIVQPFIVAGIAKL